MSFKSPSQIVLALQDELPPKAQRALLADAAKRDRATARRTALLRILWRERFLTRLGLIARVEGELGQGCFGTAAWKDTFYRDMRVVKQALAAAGYQLAYGRSRAQTGYYLRGESPLHPDLVRMVAGSVAEVDPTQIGIYQQLSPADRFRQGSSTSDTAQRAVAFRLQQRYPNLSLAEALRQLARQRGA